MLLLLPDRILVSARTSTLHCNPPLCFQHGSASDVLHVLAPAAAEHVPNFAVVAVAAAVTSAAMCTHGFCWWKAVAT